MGRLLLRLATDGQVFEALSLTKLIRLPASDGVVYALVDSESGVRPPGLTLRRQGSDLQFEVDGEPWVVLEGFYAPEIAPLVALDGPPTPAAELQAAAAVEENGDRDGSEGVVWRAGEDAGEGASEGAPVLGSLFVGLAGLGLALSSGGGGGGVAALVPSPIASAVSQSLAVSLMKGPFLQGSVELQVIGTGGLLREGEDYRLTEVLKVIDGQDVVLGFELDFSTYAGPVLLSIVDRDAEQPDFLDEVEGPVNLDAALRAFAEVPEGGRAEVAITPFTEKAVRLAEQELSEGGLGSLDGGDAQRISQILNSGEKVELLKEKVALVSTLVGVDINRQPIAVNDPDYADSEDSAAQFYGYQLAAFSQFAAEGSEDAGANGSGDVGTAIDRLLDLYTQGQDIREAIDASGDAFLLANEALKDTVSEVVAEMLAAEGAEGPVFIVSELRSDALGTTIVRFGGTVEGPVSVRFDEAGRASFSRDGLEASAKPQNLLDKMLVGVNATELRIDLTGLVTEADQTFTVNAPDAQFLVLKGDLTGAIDKVAISVADPDAGAGGTGNVVDIRTLRLDLSAVTFDSADRLVFDFAGPEDLVILDAASDLGGIKTIEVQKGTADLRAITVQDGVDFVVNSGLVVSLAQFQSLASVTSVTGLGDLTIVVSADPEQQAEDLATLQALLGDTDQVLIGSSLALEDTLGNPVESASVASAFSAVRLPSLPELAVQLAALEGLGDGESFGAEDYSTLAELNSAVKALEETTDVSGLQAQINALQAVVEQLGGVVTLKDWVEDGQDPLTLGVNEVFAGRSAVDTSLLASFNATIAGYDPATVPLTVIDGLTVAQAVALGEAGFALGTKVEYEIVDAYRTVEAALAWPGQNSALANALKVTALGNELENPVDMTAMTRDVTLRAELGDGDDRYLGSRADEEILGQGGQDTITLTYLDDSQDEIIFTQVSDDQGPRNDRIVNFQVKNDAIGLEGALLKSTLGADGAVDYVLGAPENLSPGAGETASLRAFFNLNVHEFGVLDAATHGKLAAEAQVASDQLLDADAIATVLSQVFDFEAGAASSTEDGERNTTVFAVTAADDPTRTSVWAHRQSTSGDVTVDAEELTLLASVEARDAGFSGTNFAPVAPLKDATPPVVPTFELSAESDSGLSAADRLTQNTTPTFTGTAEPGATVEVRANEESLGTTVVGDDGTWRFTVPDAKALGGGERAIAYAMTATATDEAGNRSEAAALEVTVDDLAPVFTSGAAPAVDENRGDALVLTAAATDDGAVAFRLKADNDDNADAFTIDTTTGAVTLVTPDLNHEDRSVFSFTVVATDAAGNVSEQAVTLSINDLDESQPVITSAEDASVPENLGENQVVYTVTATDTADLDDTTDTSDALSYALKDDDDDADALTIDASTGAVSLKANPNHEAKSRYSFTVLATDAAGNAAEQAVTLNITDLDESAPTFPQSGPPKLSVPSGVDGLDGDNGFVAVPLSAQAPTTTYMAGWAVSGAGDLNDDGLADVIIGAPIANASGAAYILFGREGGFDASESLLTLDGTDGFVLNGAFGDASGGSVGSAGDLNGDGISDAVIGAPGSDGAPGKAYVVFGREAAGSFDATLDLSTLDGNDGFALEGVSGDTAGVSVSGAGDLNGDGVDDLLIGAKDAGSEAGRTYVVFGSATGFGSSLSLASLDGGDGFIIEGIADGDQAGYSVSGAGDLNNDGMADLVIGAPIRGGNTGAAYVVFGRPAAGSFAAELELSNLSARDGFMIEGVDEGDYHG